MTGIGKGSAATTGGRFAGKVALVTGGGSGIGSAAAHRLAAVVLAGRRRQALDAVTQAVTGSGGRAAVRTADVTVESDVRELISFCVTTYGRLDVAFNNAGTTAATGPTDQLELAAWQAEIDANLTSVFLCLKHEIAALADGGAILNNASIAAVSGTPFLAAYTAAKHGVLGLTRSTALEVVDRGVRINALITGNVDTPLYRRLSGLGPHDALPPAPNPTGRTATTDEIASFVAYLLSDEAAFITGAALTADGGFTAN
jgi:NAD(P)-dependent dehydrogenase (short-subunit alcohol dehydrogenase family)